MLEITIKGGYLGKVPVLVCVVGKYKLHLERVSFATLNMQKGVCYFPAYPPFLQSIINDLATVFDKVVYTDNAKAVIESSQKMAESYLENKLDPNFNFKTKPFKHQKDSLIYAIHHPRCGLLLDCGLGKSKIAIDLINYLGLKSLFLVPAALITNWVDEFQTHSLNNYKIMAVTDSSAKKKKKKLGLEEFEKDVVITGSDGKPIVVDTVTKTKNTKIDADIVLISYESAAKYQEALFNNFDYDIIVADESHKIKNVKSQRTKAALALSQKAHRRLVMSGTMVTNSPTDLYSQLRFLAPQIINKPYYGFCQEHVVYATWNPRIPVGVKNLDRLNKKVRKHTVRYLKEDCLDLPTRHVINKHFDMSAEQWKMYQDLCSDEDLFLEEGHVSKEYKVVALNKLSQVTGGFMYISTKDPKICDDCHNVLNCVENSIKPYTKGCAVVQKAPPNKVRRFKSNPKLVLAMELVDEILAVPDNKILIWAKATEELKILEEALTKAKIKYVRLSDNPSEELKEFKSLPEPRVAIGNIAVGVGFTANEANYTIYYSSGFDLVAYLQSIDRNYRIGQTKPVTVYHLLARNTIDERVMQAIADKVDIVEALLTNIECIRCKHMYDCVLQNIRQYDKDCILAKKQSKRRIT